MSSVIAPFAFSTFYVSVLSAKLLHLWIFSSTVHFLALLLFLPTFFVTDFVAICIARLLLRPPRGFLTLPSFCFGILLSIIALGGASAQWGFFLNTGGELDWSEASSYAFDKEARGVLLSGSIAVVSVAVVISVIAVVTQNIHYKLMGLVLTEIYNVFDAGRRFFVKHCWCGKSRYSPLEYELDSESGTSNHEDDEATDSDYDSDDYMFSEDSDKRPEWTCLNKIPAPEWVVKTAPFAFLAFLFLVRPHRPYDHMSVTLPLTLLEAFHFGGPEEDPCRAEHRNLMMKEWPIPELIEPALWEDAHGNFKGWAPDIHSELAERYHSRVPDWLPENVPSGFLRWDPRKMEEGWFGPNQGTGKSSGGKTGAGKAKHNKRKHNKHNKRSGLKKDPPPPPKCPPMDYRDGFYSPVMDPMKITNLDDDIVAPLRGALQDGSVKVKHVVYILMESMREELFPLQQGSGIYDVIMKHNEADQREGVNDRLAQLTPHIERITGKPGNFRAADGSEYPHDDLVWDDQTEPGFGGINVVGGFTGATVSTKSLSTNLCGTWAMAVDKFDEADTESYQPCLPQIMGLFNKIKSNETANMDDFRNHQWWPALFQSMTDDYDRQRKFDKKIGFEHIVSKHQLVKFPHDSHDPLYKTINYFGYPEQILKPHITEYVRNATENNRRMFLTHFTSTTHHEWGLPEWFNRSSYLQNDNKVHWHDNFERYLNTVRFTDVWLGELMQLFDDLGVANETLIVFAGDHGQAFKEDYRKTGTYENGHVSNFRIPITLRHPHLPRFQYEANATTISVLPTILDLLINSGSLNDQDTRIASDLVYDYEGQSLIRPYRTSHNGRRAWNFHVINGGAGMLAMTSADAPWRLVIPLEKVVPFQLTNLREDPMEKSPVSGWSKEELIQQTLATYGDDAVKWVEEAIPVSKWWRDERRRLWRHI